jgi:CheY-like chemotaxis protein
MPHVLLVEVDPTTTYLLTHQLVSRGVSHVTHAATVAEALAMLDPPPDWIILDMDLPDRSGMVVLEAIRKSDMPTRVVVSSATEDKSLLAAYAACKPDAILSGLSIPHCCPSGDVGCPPTTKGRIAAGSHAVR